MNLFRRLAHGAHWACRLRAALLAFPALALLPAAVLAAAPQAQLAPGPPPPNRLPPPAAQVSDPRPPPVAPPSPVPVPGMPPARATPAPARPVDAILADVIASLGGSAALSRHRSVHTTMEITFKGLGITGTAEHYAAAGDKAVTLTSIPNLASTREGSDGTRFWSEDPINGLRILEGPEAEQARIEAAWNSELRLRELFSKIESRNEVADDGTPMECLVLTPKAGASMTECFDPKTHLMLLQRGVRSGPQGDMPFTARLSDWRQVADLKMAYATDMQVGPLAFSGRVLSVELDAPVDPALFAVPKTPRSPPDKSTAGGRAAAPKASPAKAPRPAKISGKTSGAAKPAPSR